VGRDPVAVALEQLRERAESTGRRVQVQVCFVDDDARTRTERIRRYIDRGK
jgi:hypothetical protein